MSISFIGRYECMAEGYTGSHGVIIEVDPGEWLYQTPEKSVSLTPKELRQIADQVESLDAQGLAKKALNARATIEDE